MFANRLMDGTKKSGRVKLTEEWFWDRWRRRFEIGRVNKDLHSVTEGGIHLSAGHQREKELGECAK